MERAAHEAAQARPAGGQIRVTRQSSPEQVAAYRAALARHETELAAEVAARREGMWTPREVRFARDLTRLWEEATWLQRTGQFPDGRPMCQQRQVRLGIWGVFMDAMLRRMYGEKPEGADAETWGGAEGRRGGGGAEHMPTPAPQYQTSEGSDGDGKVKATP